ncbi:hypothetical protein ACE1SV_33810 [Streptomyces sp. E-15]
MVQAEGGTRVVVAGTAGPAVSSPGKGLGMGRASQRVGWGESESGGGRAGAAAAVPPRWSPSQRLVMSGEL